jgi:hypothetical protein|tara:strand:- start:1713 stop:2225 length:513 start_codon:yes stop_codon:yes gene_type:complete
MNRLYVFLYILIILSCNKDKNDSVFIDENENFDINYSVDLNPTGDFSLIIIKDSIEFLDNGDQIGIFDNNGVIESCFPDTIPPCNSPQYGETLVGSGIWNNSQMEISVILSLDFSSFNGPILNGAVKSNPINLKVWKVQDDQEYNTDIIFEQGDGTFNSILSVISSIELK